MCPCGVIAVTVTLAVEGPGSARNSPAVLPDGGTPGMTSRVDGAAVPGSQPVTPWDSAETSAATRPMLVCTSMASTLDPWATEDRDSVTVWCGGTVIPLSSPAWTWPPSLMTLTSTLAAVESTFIRSTWTCDPPFCCPGPTNQRSEPGSAQRTLARPESCVSSASRPWAMAPPPATDQPCAAWVVACLPVAFAAGSVSRDSAPGLCARTAAAAWTGTPAGGSAVSSTWPLPVARRRLPRRRLPRRAARPGPRRRPGRAGRRGRPR